MSLDEHKTLMEYLAQARELLRAKADILRNPKSLQYRRFCDWFGSPSSRKIRCSDEVRDCAGVCVRARRHHACVRCTVRLNSSCSITPLSPSALQAARQMLLKKNPAFADKFDLKEKYIYDMYVKSCENKFRKLIAKKKRTSRGRDFAVDEELYHLFERAFGPEFEFLSKSFLYIPPPAFLLRSNGGAVATSDMNRGVSGACSDAVTSTVFASGGGVDAIGNALTAESARALTSSGASSAESRASFVQSSQPLTSDESLAKDMEHNSATVGRPSRRRSLAALTPWLAIHS